MNDTKYYVIMQGWYSDKGVVGITTDLELAKAYCKVHNAGNRSAFDYDYWIHKEDGTELITDKSFITRAKSVASKFVFRFEAEVKGGAKRWSINSKYHDMEETADTATKFILDEDCECEAELHVYTDNDELAEKIAYDFLAKKNAEECGL